MGTDPWFHVRILGFCFIILCLTGLPTLALAQTKTIDWQTTPGRKTESPILFLWGTVTLATIGRLYASLYKKKNELDPTDLANMPNEGIPIGQKLYDWYEFLTGKTDPALAEIRNALQQTERLTHDSSYNIKSEWREDLARLVGQILVRFDELETLHEEPLDQLNDVSTRLRDLMALPDEETLENMLQHTEELLKFAKGIRRAFNDWYPEETNTTLDNVIKKLEEHFTAATKLQHDYDQLEQRNLDLDFEITGWRDATQQLSPTQSPPGSPLDPRHAKTLIAHIIKQADLTPIANLLVPSSRPIPMTPTNLAKSILEGLNSIKDSIQAIYPKEKLEDFNNLDAFLKNATTWAKRGTRYYAGMSGVISTTTIVTETDADQLRNLISPKYFPNSGPLNYDQLLKAFQDINKERLDAITTGKKPMPGPAPCRHPQDLSMILVNHEQQNWTDSLDQVQHLLDDQHRQPPAPGNDDQERLFSSTDVPKLTDEDDYWTYRRSFEIFASAVTVRPAQIPQAMSRLLNRYEGKRRAYMMAYDVNANIKPTWTPTWKAILAYMDARFLDRDAHLQLFKKWLTLRYNEQRWGQDFIAEFDRIRMTLNQIAPVQGKVVISDDKSLERLMDKIPARLRDRLRYKYPNMEYQLMDDTDPTKLEDIYDWIVDEWKYLHQIGQLSDGKKTDDKRPHQPRSSAAPPAVQNPPAQRPANLPIGQNNERRVPLFGECNKPCFDTTPSVPSSMRASAMTIRQQLQDANLCFRCRRPQEDHNGPKIGCQLPGNHRLHTATRRAGAPQPDFDSDPASNAASTSGNDSGDN